ncbi:hypothetical protein I6F09_18050 [Bradyrhizobium sp. IC3195]|uniref:hypothetical protein n=1 Tax=Bradyrhizobium sp. IC3195 TaxID=2793804 RepID=UPI001CD3F634|nr:hypothetical protein [Bradyrhizobium sp. IC3195]MCA1469798.1 hypothetical protein [Bradyrhizobium sp. IC3195]
MINGLAHELLIPICHPDALPDYVVKSRDERVCAELPASVTKVAWPTMRFIKALRQVWASPTGSPRRGWWYSQEGYCQIVQGIFVAVTRHPGGWTVDREALNLPRDERGFREILGIDAGVPVVFSQFWLANLAAKNPAKLGLRWLTDILDKR